MKTSTKNSPGNLGQLRPILWLILLLAGCIQASAQTIRYVKAGGTGSGNGSWNNASNDLQGIINASGEQDQVWVAAGEYQPASGQSFSMKEGVKIYGGFVGSETALIQRNISPDKYKSTLRGNNSRVILNNENNLTNAALLDGFTITGGSNAAGAGMYNLNVSPSIVNCIFILNSTGYQQHGGGMFNSGSSPVLYNCVFKNNYGYYGGAISCKANSTPKFYNSLLINNTGNMGAGVYCYSGTYPEFTNCTLDNNVSNSGFGGIYISQSGRPSFKNSIIYDTNTKLDLINTDPTIRLNCLLDQDPFFVDSSNAAGADNIFGTSDDGLNIQGSSPAKNAGNNTYLSEVNQSLDLAKNPRITGQNVDIGAYENFQAADVNTRYVREGATGNGYSWTAAGGDLQAMINESKSGNEVWVAAGEYQPAAGQSFSMKEGVKIYGGFVATGNPVFTDRNYATHVTTLKGNGAGVITNISNGVTRQALLDGFTITGGTAANTGGGIRNWRTSPSLYNLKIKGNTARQGGGIDNSFSSMLLVNSEISGNRVTDTGSAVSNYEASSPTFINVTIAGNSVRNAVHNDQAQAVFINSIIYGNNEGIYNYQGSVAVSYSLVQGMPADAANHNLDGNQAYTDLFANALQANYALAPGSPVIQMGSNAAYSAELSTAKDLTGNARLFGSSIDIGAYENQDQIQTRYVRQGGTGNGYTWKYASGNLQGIVSESQNGNEVWVAAGQYQPASGQYFSMKEGVKIYGGFAANGNPIMTDRNWTQYSTVLKGNGSHVIRNEQNGLTNAALLDGFTITGGAADNGAGMLNYLAYPLINHCVFKANHANTWAGGIYNIGPGTTVVANSVFYRNTAQSGGAAFSDQEAKPRFINVTIVENTVTENGGAVHNYRNAETELTNSIVWGNKQTTTSSQLFSSGGGRTKAYFSVLEGGAEAILGDKTGVDVLAQNPLFTDAANGDFTLQGCSPAINIGTSSVLTNLTTDLAGNPRTYDTIVDAGAYEYQSVIQTGAGRLSLNGDVITTNITAGQTYYIHASGDLCRSVAVIVSNGVSPISGNVTVTTHVDNTVQSHNSTPYVQRHYDISPASGEMTATARITLFFTQEEFTAYNTQLGSNGLPTGVADNTGRASLRIYQYHGSPKAGQTGPGAYEGAPTTITPDLSWNYGLARWEVSFSVTGFSGFFVGSASSPLPVKLVSFSGKQTENKSVTLNWQVTEQQGIAEYVIEYSANAKNFSSIGKVAANQLDKTSYQFEDIQTQSVKIAYYRLRILEKDGNYAFSRVIAIKLEGSSEMLVYPVPAKDKIWIKGTGIPGSETQIINKTGVILKTIRVQADVQEIDISALPDGIYLIRTAIGTVKPFIKN